MNDPVKELQALEERAEQIHKAKLGAQASLEVLKAQYDEKIEELNQLGVTNVKDVPNMIQTLDEEIAKETVGLDAKLSQIEEQLEGT